MQDTRSTPSAQLANKIEELDGYLRTSSSSFLSELDILSLDLLKTHIKRMVRLSEDNVFNGILHNEYHITMRIVIELYQLVIRESSSLEKFLSIVKSVNKYWESVFTLPSIIKSKDDEDRVRKTFQILDEESEKILPITFSEPFFGLFNVEIIRNHASKCMRFMAAGLPIPWSERIECLRSSDFAAQAVSNHVRDLDDVKMHSYMKIPESSSLIFGLRWLRKLVCGPLLDSVNVYRVSREVSSNFELIVHYQDKFDIELTSLSEPKIRPIDFYVVKGLRRENGEDFSGKVIFYIHGGGFLAGKDARLFNEAVIPIGNDMPGVTIVNLCISPSLLGKFPLQGHELMDAYIHVVNGGLGFTPTEIIFYSESSGSHQSMSLLAILNDLRRKFGLDILLPKDLVFVVPALSVPNVKTPERLLASHILLPSFEVAILTMGMLKKLILKYIPTRKLTEDGQWTMDTTVYDDPVYSDKVEMIDHAYLDIIKYQHLDDFKNISLRVFSTSVCPLLPLALKVCRVWKGPFFIRLYEGLPHNFPALIGLVKDSADAVTEINQAIKSSLSSE